MPRARPGALANAAGQALGGRADAVGIVALGGGGRRADARAVAGAGAAAGGGGEAGGGGAGAARAGAAGRRSAPAAGAEAEAAGAGEAAGAAGRRRPAARRTRCRTSPPSATVAPHAGQAMSSPSLRSDRGEVRPRPTGRAQEPGAALGERQAWAAARPAGPIFAAVLASTPTAFSSPSCSASVEPGSRGTPGTARPRGSAPRVAPQPLLADDAPDALDRRRRRSRRRAGSRRPPRRAAFLQTPSATAGSRRGRPGRPRAARSSGRRWWARAARSCASVASGVEPAHPLGHQLGVRQLLRTRPRRRPRSCSGRRRWRRRWRRSPARAGPASPTRQRRRAGGGRPAARGRRPRRSAVASPMMAKSWKSTWACSMKRRALLPRHRRQRTVAHRVGPVPEALEHGVDVERLGHACTLAASEMPSGQTAGAPARRRRRTRPVPPRRLPFRRPAAGGRLGVAPEHAREHAESAMTGSAVITTTVPVSVPRAVLDAGSPTIVVTSGSPAALVGPGTSRGFCVVVVASVVGPGWPASSSSALSSPSSSSAGGAVLDVVVASVVDGLVVDVVASVLVVDSDVGVVELVSLVGVVSIVVGSKIGGILARAAPPRPPRRAGAGPAREEQRGHRHPDHPPALSALLLTVPIPRRRPGGGDLCPEPSSDATWPTPRPTFGVRFPVRLRPTPSLPGELALARSVLVPRTGVGGAAADGPPQRAACRPWGRCRPVPGLGLQVTGVGPAPVQQLVHRARMPACRRRTSVGSSDPAGRGRVDAGPPQDLVGEQVAHAGHRAWSISRAFTGAALRRAPAASCRPWSRPAASTPRRRLVGVELDPAEPARVPHPQVAAVVEPHDEAVPGRRRSALPSTRAVRSRRCRRPAAGRSSRSAGPSVGPDVSRSRSFPMRRASTSACPPARRAAADRRGESPLQEPGVGRAHPRPARPTTRSASRR